MGYCGDHMQRPSKWLAVCCKLAEGNGRGIGGTVGLVREEGMNPKVAPGDMFVFWLVPAVS